MSNSGREILKIIKKEDQEIGSIKMTVYLDNSWNMGDSLFLMTDFKMIAFIMSMWQINKGRS